MSISISNLSKKYGKQTVLNSIGFEIGEGEIVGFLGPNGAGKTTTFYMIVGLVHPNAGNIYLDDIDITNEPVYRRAQRGIGYLAQEASVFRNLSVEDNIKGVLEMTAFSKEYQRDKVESLINEFGLQKIRKSLGIQLSGGERRRTEIARALALDPKFILLDEPFAGLFPEMIEIIKGILREEKENGTAIILIEHDMSIIKELCDYVYVLDSGKNIAEGKAEDVLEDKAVKTAYLGD